MYVSICKKAAILIHGLKPRQKESHVGFTRKMQL